MPSVTCTAMTRWMRCALMIGILLALGAIAFVRADASVRVVQGGPVPQSIVFPYWAADGYYGSVVTLNNPTGTAIVVQPTLYNASGQALTIPVITLAARDNQLFNIADWISAAGAGATFQKGSLVLSFTAPEPNFLGAQISILKPAASLSFDVPPEMPAGFVSSTLEGIWWRRGTPSQANLIVTNTQATSVTATVTYSAQGSGMNPVVTTVPLAAHQTQVINLNSLTLPSKTVSTGAGSIIVGGVRITHNGIAGAVVAYGMVSDAAVGFSSHFSFVDPSTFQTQSLVAPHVMIAAPDDNGFAAGTSFTTVSRLRNMSGTTIDVTPVVTFKRTPTEDGNSATLNVRTLQPQQVDVMDVNAALAAAGVTGPFIDASIRFNYSGQTNALVAQVSSLDATANMAFEVPLKDPGITMNRYGGSYPWKIDGDYRSVAHIRNTSTAETFVLVQLDYDGGKYTSTPLTLKPQQELDLDIRKLRDLQTKGGMDEILPASVTKGRLTWYERGEEAVVGRMEIFSVSAGVASSFSCAATCCPPTDNGLHIDSSSLTIYVGDSAYVRMLVSLQSDCGDLYGPFNVSARTTWQVQNPEPPDVAVAGVASVENGRKGMVTALAAGDAMLTGTTQTGEWVRVQNGCHFIRYFDEADAPITAGPTLTGPAVVVRGQTAAFTVNTGGTPATISDWTFVSGSDVVMRPPGSNLYSWEGKVVTAGAVSVKVVVGSMHYNLSAPIRATSRSDFAFAPVQSQKVANGITPALTVLQYPRSDSDSAGKSQEISPYDYDPERIMDGGPNQGFLYTTRALNFFLDIPTGELTETHFWYVIAPDAENPDSTFYRAQCGNYHPVNNPTGYLSGATFLYLVSLHEGGPFQSHYHQYVDAQSDPTNNLGVLIEKLVGGPTKSKQQFIDDNRPLLAAAQERIGNATHNIEPCGTHAIRYPDCVFPGRANYEPYAPCP